MEGPAANPGCQSPKREPGVTGVRSRRNLVSSRIVLTMAGQHIDSGIEHVQARHRGNKLFSWPRTSA
jgi:hypothetical protein